MAMLTGLPERFDALLGALDALGDGKTFTFGFLKGCLLQKEQRNQQRVESSVHKTEEGTFVSKSYVCSCLGYSVKCIISCSHCGKTGHAEDQCFTKHHYLKQKYNKRQERKE